ncbi:MAG: hypothetical protein AB1Z21_01625, partial [Synechococcaceae cyanobacterium]
MASGSEGSKAGNGLRPVPIQELKSLAEGRSWIVAQHLEDLSSLTPVRGLVRAMHHGSVLEVEGEAETIVTLCCDRCLQHYNHPLRFRTRELIWLRREGADPATDPRREAGEIVLNLDPGGPGADSGEEGLEGSDEELDPRGSFDPGHWTFEHMGPLFRRQQVIRDGQPVQSVNTGRLGMLCQIVADGVAFLRL